MPETTTSKPSTLLAYLRLFRLPNVFTAMADVTMGFLFVGGSVDLLIPFVCLVAASSLLYVSGMVLNDVYDIEVDARERPFRPLPSGQISLGWATWLGYEMLLVGVALAWVAGYIYPDQVAINWRSGVVALILAISIVLYDAVLKKTVVAPVVMGGCRFFNVLLGMSIASGNVDAEIWRLAFDSSELIVAAGIGVYIIGVTWFARNETRENSGGQLLIGVGMMAAGLVLLASYPHFGDGANRLQFKMDLLWPMLIILIGFTIIRRCLTAALNPQPQRIQAAIKQCILSLIMLDASVCLSVRPNEPHWAIGVVALLIPTLILGRWVYST